MFESLRVSDVYFMRIETNIFIALLTNNKWSNSEMFPHVLVAVFFRNEISTDFIFWNLIFSRMNSAPLVLKFVFELSTWAVVFLSETLGSFWAFF